MRDLRARKQAERHIHFLAHHDALTGLPNRTTFNKRLDQEIETARAARQLVAVLCLDLDRFKEVNDLFGHAEGDALLQTIAKTVSAVLGSDQMMANFGGDEFAVTLPGNIGAQRRRPDCRENPAGAQWRCCSNAQASTAALMSTSIGIAIFPNDAVDRQSLLRHADTALYRAKLEGRGTYRFFEATMGAEMRDRRLLEHDLRHAISRGELSLVYQPQKDIKNDRFVRFEALLRWNHPKRGNVPPALFIPIAEESGIIRQSANGSCGRHALKPSIGTAT